jgi:uncharacterized low-complexity protein
MKTMKKSFRSKAALSMALGMSFLASAAVSLPALAANTNGLFQLSEAQPLQIAQDKDAKTSCGKASCGAAKKADHKCGSKKHHHKGHKCGASKCSAKGNEAPPPAAKE